MTSQPLPKNILFKNKYWVITLVLIIIHQSLIALSVFFLTRLIQGYQSQGEIQNNLVMYLLCMIAPYLPAFISFIYLQKWINAAHHAYIKNITKMNIFSPLHLNQNNQEESISAAVSTNSFITIGAYLYFLHDFSSLSLNSLLSMLVIGLLLPKELVLGYLLSMILSFCVIYLSRNTVKKRASYSESELINYSAILSKLWRNHCLNQFNALNWNKVFNEVSRSYYDSTQYLQTLKQGLNSLISMVALLPTAYLIYEIVLNHQTQPSVVAALVVNLTRIFTILSSLNSLLHALIELPALNARLNTLFKSVVKEDYKNIDDSLFLRKITLNDEPIVNYNLVLSLLKNSKRGRYTIRGENGSGKSTLLSRLKADLGHEALIMPTNNMDIMWGIDESHLSTGIRSIRILEKIAAMSESYILLDEWDANLDSKHVFQLNALLEKLSEEKLIIEIRH